MHYKVYYNSHYITAYYTLCPENMPVFSA